VSNRQGLEAWCGEKIYGGLHENGIHPAVEVGGVLPLMIKIKNLKWKN